MDQDTRHLAARIEGILGAPVRSISPLAGGMIGRVVQVSLADGTSIVAKEAGTTGASLEIEASMNRHLRETGVVPVPSVLHASTDLVLLEFMPGDHLTAEAHADLGRLIARLHDVTAPAFGFGSETLNGAFPLPNDWHDAWIPFFRDNRLIHSADAAVANGTLTPEFRDRIDRLCEGLDAILVEPERPSLLHGDLWSANVLATGPNVTALIDPSVVYGHPELELAYAIGMGGVGDGFIKSYSARRPIDGDFWARRIHAYQIYPAIMHVYYFGARYEPLLDRCLTGAGF